MTLLNSATALAVATAGPGVYALDHLFGVRLPRWLTTTFAVGAAGTVIYGMLQRPDAPPTAAAAQEDAEAQGIATGVETEA